MIRALYASSTGMQAQQMTLDTIANNLANVNTTGFKGSRVDFQDLLYNTVRTPGTAGTQGTTVPTGIQVGHGARPVATQRILTQGDFQQTENPLDLSIEGDGFFQVTRPDGTIAYTRSGAFKKDGTVSITTAGQANAQQIGTLQIAQFVNPAGLLAVGRNLLTPTAASGAAIVGTPGVNGLGTLTQGFLEMSNVKVVDEMVAMITSQRAYEANSKAIQTADEMLTIANNLRR